MKNQARPEERLVLSPEASKQLARMMVKSRASNGGISVGGGSVRAKVLQSEKVSKSDRISMLHNLYDAARYAEPAATTTEKALPLNAPKGQVAASQEITDIDSVGRASADNFIQPPYDLATLSTMLTVNVMHQTCIDAKARDIASNGYTLERSDAAKDMPDTTWDEWRKDAEEFFNACTYSRVLEGAPLDVVLHALATDYLSMGCCGFEVLRNKTGLVSGMNHIPFSTMRVAREEYESRTGIRFIQVKGQVSSGFIPFGNKVVLPFSPVNAQPKEFPNIETRTSMITWADSLPKARMPEQKAQDPKDSATEFYMMARPPFVASQTYGTPSGLTALPYIISQLKIDEYNIQFFSAKGVPQYAVILEGLTPPTKDEITDDDATEATDPLVELEAELNEFFTEKLMSSDRSVVLITTFGEAKAKFQKLSDDKADAAFENYEKRSSSMIRMAHNVPGAAIGLLETANLGSGRDSIQMRRYYEHAILPDQRSFEMMLNFLLRIGRLNPFVCVKLNPINFEDREREEDMNHKRWIDGALSLDEYRETLGMPPVGPENGGNLFIIRQSGITPLNPSADQAASFIAKYAARNQEAVRKLGQIMTEYVEGTNGDEIQDDEQHAGESAAF